LKRHVFPKLDQDLDAVVGKVVLVFAAIEVDLAGVAHRAEVELKLFVDLNHQGVHAIQPSREEEGKRLNLGQTVRFPRILSVQK
jgi:hypothetical protein